MSEVSKVIQALSTVSPDQITIKRESWFGPRKVVVATGGKLVECSLKDLLEKVHTRAVRTREVLGERPENFSQLQKELSQLHIAIRRVRELGVGSKEAGLFSRIFETRGKILTEISEHMSLTRRLINCEKGRMARVVDAVVDGKESTLIRLKHVDKSFLAKNFSAIEANVKEKIKDLPESERKIAENKMDVMKEMVQRYTVTQTVSILLDGKEKWDIKHLRKMDFVKVIEEFPTIEAELRKEISNLPPNQQLAAEKKLEIFRELITYGSQLKNDHFKSAPINDLVICRLEIKNKGISERLPTKLIIDRSKDAIEEGKIVDDQGRAFDHLRQNCKNKQYIQGDTSTERFAALCKERDGNYKAIRGWFKDQAVDSWSVESRKFKEIFKSFREVPEDEIWGGPPSFEKVPRPTEAEKRTALMHMAYVAELLSKTDFPGKNSDGTVTIYRTEAKEVLEMHQINQPSLTEEHIMPRGFAESGSILAPFFVNGTEVTEQRVPFHRIVGTFMTERLLSDKEKEFICMLDGIPFKYTHSFAA